MTIWPCDAVDSSETLWPSSVNGECRKKLLRLDDFKRSIQALLVNQAVVVASLEVRFAENSAYLEPSDV